MSCLFAVSYVVPKDPTPCVTFCNIQISSNRNLQKYHAVVIRELRNMDMDTFYNITSYHIKRRPQCITVFAYGNRNLEINHNRRFAIYMFNNMAELKCPANKQITTHVNKQKKKSYALIEFSLSSLLLFIS
jgi:hypothetical protein